jgi:hypothetical protein
MTTAMAGLYYMRKYCNTLTVPPRWHVNIISAVLILLTFQVCSSTHTEGVCSQRTSVMGEECVLQDISMRL